MCDERADDQCFTCLPGVDDDVVMDHNFIIPAKCGIKSKPKPYKLIGRIECTNGKEIRMFDGDGDNEGTVAEMVYKCSRACLSKKNPTYGSWTGFVPKGFIVRHDNGRCWCEDADSNSCSKEPEEHYRRYDFIPTQIEDESFVAETIREEKLARDMADLLEELVRMTQE
jgi:hypothetical protein